MGVMSGSETFSSAVVYNATNSEQTPFLDMGYASTAYMLNNSALVFIMTPAVGFFYSGLSSSKSGLSLIFMSCGAAIVVTMQVRISGKQKKVG